jgi:hypothetical protein
MMELEKVQPLLAYIFLDIRDSAAAARRRLSTLSSLL